MGAAEGLTAPDRSRSRDSWSGITLTEARIRGIKGPAGNPRAQVADEAPDRQAGIRKISQIARKDRLGTAGFAIPPYRLVPRVT